MTITETITFAAIHCMSSARAAEFTGPCARPGLDAVVFLNPEDKRWFCAHINCDSEYPPKIVNLEGLLWHIRWSESIPSGGCLTVLRRLP